MRRILIVETDQHIVKSIKQLVQRTYADAVFEMASTQMRVQSHLDPAMPFDLIFWGGNIEGGDTIGLIAMARQLFPTCPMVAMSTTLMDKQLRVGCNFRILKPYVDMDVILVQAFPTRQ